jgi:hypothetical protein
VDYVLYTAEQVIEMDISWASTMKQHLESHADYLCSADISGEYTSAVEALLNSFKREACKAKTSC